MKKIFILITLACIFLVSCNDKVIESENRLLSNEISVVDDKLIYEESEYYLLETLKSEVQILSNDNWTPHIIKSNEEYYLITSQREGDNFTSRPVVSPDEKNIAFLTPYEFETISNVSIFSTTDMTNKNITYLDYSQDMSFKSVNFLDNENLLVVIGAAYGTISWGGELYLLNINTEELTLIREVANDNEQIIEAKLVDDKISLEIIIWDDNFMEHEKIFKEMDIPKLK